MRRQTASSALLKATRARAGLVCLALALLLAPQARAAVFAVTSTADVVDAAPGDGVCDTGTGACTLRAAVQETNALAGADVINLPAGTYWPTFPPWVWSAGPTSFSARRARSSADGWG